MRSRSGSVYKRCGCRDARSGARLDGRCGQLAVPGHGSWYFTVELTRGPGGQRRRFRHGGYRTRQAAERALAELMPPGGDPGSDPLLSTGEWLQRWLVDRQGLRPTTRRAYAAHLRLYLLPHLGRIPLCVLAPHHVQAMFTAIATEHERADRRWTPASAVRLRATLRVALNVAIRRRLIATNAARDVELPVARRPHAVVWTAARVAAWQATGTRPAVAVWTAEQTASFLRFARSDPLYPLYHLIAFRGLRRGEAAGLTWPEVELDDATVTISQQLLEDNGKLVFGPPKSETSRRTIPIDRATVAVLRAHQRRQRRLHGDTVGLVFTRDDGRPVRPEYVTRHFQDLVGRAGLPPIRLHDLRHGAASLALHAGADLKVIQDLLGHSSIVLTADTYTSVLPDLARQAAEATSRLILSAAKLPPGRHPVPPGHTPATPKIRQHTVS